MPIQGRESQVMITTMKENKFGTSVIQVCFSMQQPLL